MKARTLDVIGLLYIATGVFGLVNYVSDLVSTNNVVFDMRILCLWIGRWLIDRDLRGYQLAVFVSGAIMILAPTLLVLGAVLAVLSTKWPDGFDFRPGAWLVYTFFTLAWAGLHAFLFYALRRPHARALFPDSAARNVQPTTAAR